MLQALQRKPERRIGATFSVLLAFAAAFLAFLQSDVAPASPAGVRVVPSATTTRFLDAFSSGDEVLAESLASPLYAAEWRRLGVSAAERSTLGGGGTAALRKALRFEYYGGIRSAHGFEHYLYGVQSIEPAANGRRMYTIWRVDADPRGRVVWLALVYLLGQEAGGFRLVDDQLSLEDAASRAGLTQAGWQTTLGIAAANEGATLYLAGFGRSGDAAPTRVRTFTLDLSGKCLPGSWAYGLDFGVHSYPPPVGKSIEVETENWGLLLDYLATID